MKNGESQVIYFSNQGFTRAVRNISKIGATGARSMGCWNRLICSCICWIGLIGGSRPDGQVACDTHLEHLAVLNRRGKQNMFHHVPSTSGLCIDQLHVNFQHTPEILQGVKQGFQPSGMNIRENITWDRRKSTSFKKLNPWTPRYRPISAFFLSKIPIVLQL